MNLGDYHLSITGPESLRTCALLCSLHWVLTSINSFLIEKVQLLVQRMVSLQRHCIIKKSYHTCQVCNFIIFMLSKQILEFCSTRKQNRGANNYTARQAYKYTVYIYVIYHIFCLFRGLSKCCSSYVSLEV